MLQKIRANLNNLEIKYVDNIYIFIPSVLLAIIEVILFYIWGYQTVLLVTLPLILFLILSFMFHLYRKLAKDLEEERRQNQALQSIHYFLDLHSPLPPMSHWAAYPELGNVIIEYASLLNPNFIMEAGSGVSTLISCYCLKKNGDGKLLSLDHDKSYSLETNKQLTNHNLESFGIVQFAPLKEYKIDDNSWEWYDLDGYDGKQKIDILIIDGPPVETQPHARYPALPLLYEHLSNRVAIILDDAGRESETEVIHKWLEQYPEFKLDYKPSKKGIAILTRNI